MKAKRGSVARYVCPRYRKNTLPRLGKKSNPITLNLIELRIEKSPKAASNRGNTKTAFPRFGT
jgi:hypothetical protein